MPAGKKLRRQIPIRGVTDQKKEEDGLGGAKYQWQGNQVVGWDEMDLFTRVEALYYAGMFWTNKAVGVRRAGAGGTVGKGAPLLACWSLGGILVHACARAGHTGMDAGAGVNCKHVNGCTCGRGSTL